MNGPPLGPTTLPGYTIRLLDPADAPGVTRIVEDIYGDTYYPRDLYDPDEIVRRNADGTLVSCVALDTSGRVVGHYALERPRHANIAEASDALVEPAHRHHHLMEEMRLVLRAEANRVGLTGLVGYPVTNHLYSQKAEEHFGGHSCGIALGLWPRTFHNMPEPLPQRMSFVVSFKYLRLPAEAQHVATRHHEVIARTYEQYGVPVRTSEPAPAVGPTEVALEHEPEVQTGTIHVRRVGDDTPSALREGLEKLCNGFGARTITLELPLAQSGTAEACRAAEELGFYFCGLGPAFAADGDALLLQYLTEDIDLSLLQIDDPFARDLLAYVGQERERAQKAARA